MGKSERQNYLLAIKKRYKKARKGDKKLILNEFCAVCGYNHKYAICVLNQKKTTSKKKRKPGPKSIYHSAELLKALKKIWFVSDQMCSKRLVALLPIWLPFYQLNYGKLSEETVEQLNTISASTIDLSLLFTRKNMVNFQFVLQNHPCLLVLIHY